MRATILPEAILLTKAHRAADYSQASVVLLIFTTQIDQYFSVFFPFALFCDEPEVFFPNTPKQ